MRRLFVRRSPTRRTAIIAFLFALCLAAYNRMSSTTAQSGATTAHATRLSAEQLRDHFNRKVIIPHESRFGLPKLLETEKFEVGAEIGVQRGGFAKEILSKWQSCRKFVLVDMWRQQESYSDWANVNNSVQEAIYSEAVQAVSPWKEKVAICRDSSLQCATKYADNHFDFVYIDARHDYKGVSDDLKAWWPKVRVGGIMAGHDYIYADEQKQYMPDQDWGLASDGSRHNGAVRGAVIDFFMHDKNVGSDHYRQVVTTFKDGNVQSWEVRK